MMIPRSMSKLICAIELRPSNIPSLKKLSFLTFLSIIAELSPLPTGGRDGTWGPTNGF